MQRTEKYVMVKTKFTIGFSNTEPCKHSSRSRIGSIQGFTPTSRQEIPFLLFSVICYLMR